MDHLRSPQKAMVDILKVKSTDHKRINAKDACAETQPLLKSAIEAQDSTYSAEAGITPDRSFATKESKVGDGETSLIEASKWSRLLPKPSKAVIESQKASRKTPEYRSDPFVEAMKYGSVLRV